MKKMNKIQYVLVGLGVVIIGLIGVLVVMILSGSELWEGDLNGVASGGEFIYDRENDYGNGLLFSDDVKDKLFSTYSNDMYDAISRRLTAFFAVKYPQYLSFGLMKDSFYEVEKGKEIEYSATLVSNQGTLVKIKLIDSVEDDITYKTTLVLLDIYDQEAYRTSINWKEELGYGE